MCLFINFLSVHRLWFHSVIVIDASVKFSSILLRHLRPTSVVSSNENVFDILLIFSDNHSEGSRKLLVFDIISPIIVILSNLRKTNIVQKR